MSEAPQVFLTNHEGVYIGSRPVRMDPRRPDRPLIPEGATLDAPPDLEEGQVAVLNESREWVVLEDHRGKEGWIPKGNSFERIRIASLGSLPEGFTEENPIESVEPKIVRNLSFTLALIENEIFPEDVEALIDDIPDRVAKETARAKWQASNIHRDDPTLLALAAAYGDGLSSLELDAIFSRAVELDRGEVEQS